MKTMTVTVILFILYIFILASGYWLRFINLSHLRLHGAEVPSGFEGTIECGNTCQNDRLYSGKKQGGVG